MDIEINAKGDFIRTNYFETPPRPEGIYSPITQNQRHLEMIRKVRSAAKNSFIAKIAKGVDLLTLEAQRFIQFIRFSDFNGALISTIKPEHIVLPLLADHFIERYINEQFLIYDKTHRMGLIYTDHKARIEFLEDYAMPNLTEEEKSYQKLWRLFYDTVAIKERRNERCRMNFMPKKYWKNMTEFLKD